MTIDPFASKIAAAQQREAEEVARAKDAKYAKDAELAERRAKNQAERERAAREAETKRIVDFGKRFLEAVASKVAADWMKPGRIDQIRQFSVALLSYVDKPLPNINRRDRDQILDKFEYGLQLSSEHGFTVPEGMLYGQRLVAEREAQREARQQQKLVIRQGKPDKVHSSVDKSSAAVVPAKPATTPRRKGKDRRPAHLRSVS